MSEGVMCNATGHYLRQAYALERLGIIAMGQGHPAWAARVWGAAARLRGELARPLAPFEHRDYEQAVVSAYRQLGERTFAALWAQGSAMTAEQALTFHKFAPLLPFSSAEPVLAGNGKPLTTSSEAPQPVQRMRTGEATLPSLELRLLAFGTTQVYRGDRELSTSDWVYRKVRELLFYLLSAPARTKEQIGLALWPDASTAQLRNNLHEDFYYLRRALGHPSWIIYEKKRYTFNRQYLYWYDVEAFVNNIDHARQYHCRAPEQAISVLEQAVSLYRGDFLEDVSAGDWVSEQREELRRLYQEALLLLGRLYSAQGQCTQAAEIYRKLITHDRYQECAHRELMRCYALLGERSQALRHYRQFAQWMREELGAWPSPETRDLFRHLRREEKASAGRE